MEQRVKVVTSNLLVYSTAHAAVDAICAGILFSIPNEQIAGLTVVAYLFVVYNLLAFGLQLFLGFLVDHFKAPRLSAISGLALVGIAAMIFVSLPIVSVILAGFGNALFHVGGGIISLSLTPKKATAPGIFVAPGALGLMIGALLGKNGNFTAWPFILALAVLAILIFIIKKPATYQKEQEASFVREFKFEYVLYLVLFVIAVRSLVGLALVFPWKTDFGLLIILTLSIVLGKGVGGLLADKFGWKPVAVGSLVVSIPLLTFGISVPVLGIMGMFLFNFTMPVTLTMISNMIPGKPGTAFGLTCLALILGALPSFTELNSRFNTLPFTAIVISVSVVALYLSLRYYYKGQPEITRNTVSPSGSRGITT